jgi:hypothetical protein
MQIMERYSTATCGAIRNHVLGGQVITAGWPRREGAWRCGTGFRANQAQNSTTVAPSTRGPWPSSNWSHYVARRIMWRRCGGTTTSLLRSVDRESLSTCSQSFEKGEQRIRRAISTRPRLWRRGPSQGALFEGKVGVEVHAIGGADVFVAENQSDRRRVDMMTQKIHGTTVAKGVRRYFLCGQRRTLQCRRRHMALNEASHSVAAESFAAGSWEQRIFWHPSVFVEPGSDHRAGFSTQRVIRSLRPLP